MKLSTEFQIFLICASCILINTLIISHNSNRSNFLSFTSSLGLSVFAASVIMNLDRLTNANKMLSGGKFGDDYDFYEVAFGRKNTKVGSYKKK